MILTVYTTNVIWSCMSLFTSEDGLSDQITIHVQDALYPTVYQLHLVLSTYDRTTQYTKNQI